MNNKPIVRPSGWEIADKPAATEAYLKIQSEINTRTPDVVIQIRSVVAPTMAEHRGLYVREIFSLYTAILGAMRSTDQWIAINAHSTDHTRNLTFDTVTN